MPTYFFCAQCGEFTDDGGSVNGEWLCPDCYNEDDGIEDASSASTEVEI